MANKFSFLRLIVGSLLVFSLIFIFLFALFPSEISVTRVVAIQRSPLVIQQKIGDLRQWKSWNNFLFDARGGGTQDGTIDSVSIQRLNVRVNLLRIASDTIFTRWQSDTKAFDGNFIIQGNKVQSTVEWTLHFHVKWYPWDKMSSMFYDRQLGPVMEQSLLKLRDGLEPEKN